jgi:hypothetical protein
MILPERTTLTTVTFLRPVSLTDIWLADGQADLGGVAERLSSCAGPLAQGLMATGLPLCR